MLPGNKVFSDTSDKSGMRCRGKASAKEAVYFPDSLGSSVVCQLRCSQKRREGALSRHHVCQGVCGVLKKKKKHSTKSETIFLCTDPDGGKGPMSCHITPDQYFQIYNRALCHKLL